MEESKVFLSEQIITYLGNKRSLLSFIGNAVEYVKKDLKKEKIDTFDVFAGSGIVSRDNGKRIREKRGYVRFP